MGRLTVDALRPAVNTVPPLILLVPATPPGPQTDQARAMVTAFIARRLKSKSQVWPFDRNVVTLG